MVLVTLAAAITIQAADYVYTNNARYKVMGQNLFTQGSVEDNLGGWRSASNRALSEMPDTFAIENEGGPDGGKYLTIKAGGIGASIVNADVMLEPGQTYYFTYKVKGSAERQNFSMTVGNNNYQNIFVNADGSISTSATGYAAVASSKFYYNDTWTEMGFAYTVPADAPLFLVMDFEKLLEGDCFADFAAYQVQEVSDDRVLRRVVDRAKLLLGMDELTQGKSGLQGLIGEMEEFLAVNESANDQKDYLAGLEDEISRFLAQNGVDIAPYFSHFTFDDISPKSNSNISGWNTGYRWGTAAANAVFTTVFGVQSIGNSYELGYASLQQEKALPAGKYLYVISAQGYDLPNKSDIVDYRSQIAGVKMFINNDSLDLADLPTWGPKNYAKVFTVNEGETVNLGICNTGISNANQIWFDNHYVYLLGGTKEQVDNYVNAQKLADALYALKVMTDSAKVVVEKPQYIFGKQALRDSIAKSEAVYAAENDPVNSPAVLTAQMNNMRSAIRAYYTLNVEVVTLKEDLDDCKALLANERYTEGKTELKAVVDKVDVFYVAIDPEVRDSLAIMQHDEALVAAREEFYVANASYKNPGQIAINNPTFLEGPSSKSSAVPGWDDGNVNRNSKSGWQAGANTAFETGYALGYARNNSSCEAKYLGQDVKLERAGVYTFSAEMQAYHSGGKNNANTGVYFFVGQEGFDGVKIDSLVAYTPDQVPVRYKINVVIDQPTTLRFGVEARNNKACTRIFVSGCQVAYSGAYDKYQRDSAMAVAQPTIDSLAAEIAVAQTLKNTSRNKESFAAAVKTFEAAISHAETVKAKEVTSAEDLKAVADEIEVLKAAEEAYKISGVWPAEGEYFDLTAYLKNADLTDVETNESNEKVFTNWISEGNTASQNDNGLMNYVFNESSAKDMKVHQVVEGMPAGKFQFMANATYKLETNSVDFPQDEDMNGLTAVYNACQIYTVEANNTSMVMKGLLTGCKDDEWQEILSARDYRHHRYGTAFDGDRYENWLEFELTAADGGKVDLGIAAKGAAATQVFWAKNFRLLFWGDKVTTGIDEAVRLNNNEEMRNNNVYDIQGRRVVNMTKGLYIMNGKKIVVK
jgi:hypothetical protein